MIYLALAVACSLAIGTVFKFAGRAGMDFVRLLTVNYVTASLVALLLLVSFRPPSDWTPLTQPVFLLFCALAGVVMIGGFLIFARATARAGMSVSMAVMRMGVSIPFLVSWLVWDEVPSSVQWVGVALVGCALAMITRPDRSREPNPGVRLVSNAGILLAVFVAGGAGDLTFKAFDVWYGSAIREDAFIAVTFGISFLLGVLVLARGTRDGRRFTRSEIGWGIFLGLINYGSVLFILGAVARLPGTVVFPTNALSIVVGGALIGMMLFHERLTAVNLAGVAVAAAAVVLLNG